MPKRYHSTTRTPVGSSGGVKYLDGAQPEEAVGASRKQLAVGCDAHANWPSAILMPSVKAPQAAPVLEIPHPYCVVSRTRVEAMAFR